MTIWKKRLNDYGLSDVVIIFIIIASMISVVAEIISIGMFLPLFELINQNGVENLGGSSSRMALYIHDFMKYVGLDPTIEI